MRVPRRLRCTWDRGRLADETTRFLQRNGDAIRSTRDDGPTGQLFDDNGVVPW